MADKELYKVCAVEVKRQIWQDNQALFGDEVSPLLKQYIVEKEAALFSSDLSILHNFFSPSPKMRRQGEVSHKLNTLTTLVHDYIFIFSFFCQVPCVLHWSIPPLNMLQFVNAAICSLLIKRTGNVWNELSEFH